MEHRNNFDLIRLFAAAQVMVSHAIAHLKLPVHPTIQAAIDAFPGVPIFFVVSGFLISGSWARKRDIRSFSRNRALRIYPALWANLVGITLLLAIFGGLAFWPWDFRFWLWHLIAFVFASDHIASNLLGGLFNGQGIFSFYPSGVLWTLPVELSFYLLVPVILAAPLLRRGLAGLSIGIWVAISLLSYFMIARVGDWVLFIGLYLWMFLIGAATQVYWPRVRRIFEGKAVYWLAVHGALTAGLIAATGAQPVYVVPAWTNILHTMTLGALAISIAFTATAAASGALHGRDISYGLYLWHMPVICVLAGCGLTGSWLVFLFAAAVSVIFADLSRRVVEEPALALRKRPLTINAPIVSRP